MQVRLICTAEVAPEHLFTNANGGHEVDLEQLQFEAAAEGAIPPRSITVYQVNRLYRLAVKRASTPWPVVCFFPEQSFCLLPILVHVTGTKIR